MKKSLLGVLLLLIVSIVVVNGIANMIFDGEVPNIIDRDDERPGVIIKEKPTKIEIDILAVGDIMFHMPQVNSGRVSDNHYDFKPMFKHVKSYIEGADLALGNLETVTVGDRRYSGYPTFNSPVETIEALKDAGFDVISTANNHSADQGKTGIISTIEAIKDNGLDYVGTSLDRDTSPLIVDIEGLEIGVLSYTYGLNGLDSILTSDELSYMVNLIDEENIQNDIQYLKENEVDLIISYVHWGTEYQRQPSEYQESLARNMVEWGVNIVLGSHPHVLQRGEILEHNGRDNLVVYSMGNFLSNQREITMGNSYAEDGVMVNISVEKDLKTSETSIKGVEYTPTWVYRYGSEEKYYYEILPTEEVVEGTLDINLDSVDRQRLEKSYNDVREMYDGE